jgi:hypothetical protein
VKKPFGRVGYHVNRTPDLLVFTEIFEKERVVDGRRVNLFCGETG